MSHSRRLATLAAALLPLLMLPGTAEAQFGKNKIQYQEFDWKIYHSPHFDVYYYTAEEHLLERVVSFAESAYDELSRRFDYQIEQSTPLIFYKTHAEFEQNNIILGFIPEAVGAFATDVRFRMVLPVDMPDSQLHELVLHELTHIFQYHILYGGKVSRTLASQPPTWLIEGMASYYAQDESTDDKMFLRDAVVNDLVPPITQAQGGGFFAYRFGHAVFDFMEERWGDEGVLDFLLEYRSTLGGNVDRALMRAFRVEAEDFDADFRRWLREKYLPELIKTGEPSYFGRRFLDERGNAEFFSPVASPSGDLVAALGSPEGKLDVLLFDTHERRMVRNLTKGWSSDYQYLTGQFATATRRMGSDLAFSPDGNWIVAFGRRESGRSLLFIDVIHGGIRRIVDLDVQQPFGPAWSADGRTIAFAGNREGNFDIFLFDVESEQVTNLTNDERFDGGPAFSPNGTHLIYSSEVGAYAKLFRLELANPANRLQLGVGEHSEKDPTFTRDGQWVFFTSDRDGFDNIYSLDLTTGELRQHTNAVTGCFMPTVLERADGTRYFVYNGFWRGSFDLYRADLDQLPEVKMVLAELTGTEPTAVGEAESYEPDIQVTIDEENKEDYGGFKLFLEDGDVGVGVTSDNLIVSQTLLTFSDYLGDRRLFVRLDSVSSFSDFDITYFDLSDRLQWGARLFDDREYYLTQDLDGSINQESAYQQTGIQGLLIYPLNFYHRVEGSLAYQRREYDFVVAQTGANGEIVRVIEPRTDEYPELAFGLVGDTTVFSNWGPFTGRRYRFGASYAPDLEGEGSGGTLTSTGYLDVRQYLPITRRINVALRAFGGASGGSFPDVFFFGGLDTVRGFDTRQFYGDRVFYTNFELRFPLVDALILPFLAFQGIRGRIFLDVGGAWNDYQGETFDFWDSDEGRLATDNLFTGERGPHSSYGWGLTIRFSGLDLHWDFARVWDFDESLGEGFETAFWIGPRF